MAQCADGRPAFLADVDHVLGQRADNAVPAGVNPPDLVGMTARGLDQAAGGCIDDGGYAAGLCIKRVLLGHNAPG